MSSVIEFLAQTQLYLTLLGISLIVVGGGLFLLLTRKKDAKKYSAMPGMYLIAAGFCLAMAYPFLYGIDALLEASTQN